MSDTRTRTFRELKDWVLTTAKVATHLGFLALGTPYVGYWESLNEEEYRRGYKPGAYEKPDSPALCDMLLLTDAEFASWQQRFNQMHTASVT